MVYEAEICLIIVEILWERIQRQSCELPDAVLPVCTRCDIFGPGQRRKIWEHFKKDPAMCTIPPTKRASHLENTLYQVCFLAKSAANTGESSQTWSIFNHMLDLVTDWQVVTSVLLTNDAGCLCWVFFLMACTEDIDVAVAVPYFYCCDRQMRMRMWQEWRCQFLMNAEIAMFALLLFFLTEHSYFAYPPPPPFSSVISHPFPWQRWQHITALDDFLSFSNYVV